MRVTTQTFLPYLLLYLPPPRPWGGGDLPVLSLWEIPRSKQYTRIELEDKQVSNIRIR
jgi:hypothetical protein